MSKFRGVTQIVLSCPTCHVNGAHKHEMLDDPQHGRDCHLIRCLVCQRETLMTRIAFDSIADRIQAL
jgi:hypothetical protein